MLPLTTKSVYLERMLEHKATSYKLFWLKSILEEVQETQCQQISFDRLVTRMISEAWYPLVKYRLNLGHQDKLQRVVDYVVEHYGYTSKTSKEKILNALYHSEKVSSDKDFQWMKKQFYDMVPYRLINPFFSEQTKGIRDQKKNRLIEKLASESEACFYKIITTEKNSKSICIQEDWVEYLYKNYAVIRGWLENKLILYLQTKNPSVPNIPLKLDRQATRRLQRATEYWKLINWEGRFKDIYTDRYMTQENYHELGAFSIDHYIPWSFVMHDELWITIPTFKTVNSAKNDQLPNLGKYLDTYCLNHYEAFTTTKERYRDNPKKKVVLEDYLNLGGNLNSEEILHDDVEVSAEVFVDSMKQTIIPLYQIAHNQGFEIWQG